MVFNSVLCLALWSTFQSLSSANVQPCPLLGPDVPKPKLLSNSSSLSSALQLLNNNISQAIVGQNGSSELSSNNVSFSIDIYSVHEEQSLWTFFHDAPELTNATVGVQNLDENTMFRIGSISKLFSVYTALIELGNEHWNQPVSKYIPEFADYMSQHSQSDGLLNTYDFDAITLHDLASQISGITRDNSVSASFQAIIQELIPGLPAVDSLPDTITSENCSNQVFVPCTRAAYFGNILARHPLWSAGSQPAYSNIAYGLLALAVENITGQPFENLFARRLISPLNLTSTLYNPPSSIEGINAIIPYDVNASTFLDDLQFAAPAGAFYSSLADMRVIGRAMLSSSQLPQAITNRWFKPVTLTSSPLQSVGAPWEIYTYAPPNWQGRKVDLYSKGGAIGLYRTLTVLIPTYDVGFTVLAAGGGDAQGPVSDIVAKILLPALHEAAHEEARSKYAGTFTNPASNSSITIDVPNTSYNESGPGLRLTDYTYQGFDMRNVFATLTGAGGSDLDIRLYPSDDTNANGTVQQWWAVAYSKAQQQLYAEQQSILSASQCWEWYGLDGVTYGGATADDFLVRLDGAGKAVGITPRVWKTEYERT